MIIWSKAPNSARMITPAEKNMDTDKRESVARNASWHLHILMISLQPLLMRDWSLKPDFTVEIYPYPQDPVMSYGPVESGGEVMANFPDLGLHITIRFLAFLETVPPPSSKACI